MNIVLFYHSLLSDWNHGNAHFLRGVVTELLRRGNTVSVYEPENGWSYTNMIAEKNVENVVEDFYEYYPGLESIPYNDDIDLDNALKDADLVIVHEWNDHKLVKAIGEKRKKYPFKLLFHDTHHRSVTDEKGIGDYDLSNYDGVLAFGNIIKELYLQNGWAKKAWTWHEAADTNIFKPLASAEQEGDIVWIGNWGDEERTKELFEFIIDPVKELGLKGKIYGVGYPKEARQALKGAGISYEGWLPNFKAPEVFSRYRFTVHVPRGPYTKSLPGIPTIRPFEALACGIPLLSAPWNDSEGLFTEGEDFIMVNNKAEMKEWMNRIMTDDTLTAELVGNGLRTISRKHTCAHRVSELYGICKEIGVNNCQQEIIA